MSTSESIRRDNLKFLNDAGFKPAQWMPLPMEAGQLSTEPGYSGGTLRPTSEIADRFLCLAAVFSWGSAPDDFEALITKFVGKNSLRQQMTDDEVKLLELSKTEAREQFGHVVGWRLENMWSLGWLLGLVDSPSATTGQLGDNISGKMMNLFLPEFELTTEEILDVGQPVSNEEAVKAEDLFFLAHNAIRSGQLGNADCVPVGFDPIADGGAIHERRHSLTWALSPGTAWDETDLST